LGDKLQKYLNDEAFIVQSECGLSLVNAKLQIVNAELSMRYGRKVIHHKSNRIKSYDSIIAKLERKGLDYNFEVIQEKINDLVGVRAICSYTDDLYQIAEMLCNQKDVKLIKIKDYIRNPKASGYRSLHLIIEVPICFQNSTQWIKIELQLRTAAMDYWAGLDYQLRYKKGEKKADIIGEELKEYAFVIENMDSKVLELRKRIEAI
jgi:putative GTP pyrophosphokinase